MSIRFTPFLLLLLALPAARAGAQLPDAAAPTATAATAPSARIATGVVPDTVTVGDPFTVIVRVAADDDARVTVRLAPDSAAAVQPLAPATLSSDSGGTTFVQRMVAWRTGALAGREAIVRVAPPTGAAREYRVALRTPYVRSVLPADTSALKPKPAAPPLAAPRLAWRGAALLALLVVAALAAWARRRATGRKVIRPPRDPRSEALALLADARAGGFLEAGEWAAFYSLVSEALRVALAARSPAWARDLTTRELAATSTPVAPLPPPVLELLERADRVKFAAAAVPPETAATDWVAADAWVRGGAEEEDDNAPAAGRGAREVAS